MVSPSTGKPIIGLEYYLSAENKGSEYPGWIVYTKTQDGDTVILRTDAGNLANRIKPWEVGTSTNWWGEMMLPIDGNFSLSNSVFIPNGDKTRYVTISGCPIELINGTYYQMDPITINGKTHNLCFTNGVYMFEASDIVLNTGYLYELDNSSFLNTIFHFVGGGNNMWFNYKTSELISGMKIEKIGNWPGYD